MGGIIVGIVGTPPIAGQVMPSSPNILAIVPAIPGRICEIEPYNQLHDVQPVTMVFAPYTQVLDQRGDKKLHKVATTIDMHTIFIQYINS